VSAAYLGDGAPAELFQAPPPSLSRVRLPRNARTRGASGNTAPLDHGEEAQVGQIKMHDTTPVG